MAEKQLTGFGKKVKITLVKRGRTQKWLIGMVVLKTGLYFDRSYLSKTLTGKYENPKIVEAIKEVLNL